MLKMVLSAMPSHSMMCFKLRKSLTKRIQSAYTRFWWDTSQEKKKMCWVSWERLTQSKADGGLGFRDIEAFNDALLPKQGWCLLKKPDCLLAKVLMGKYCAIEPFLSVSASNSCSHGWRSILCGRDLLLQNTRKAIGNGEDTMMWDEPWLSTEEPRRPIGPPDAGSKSLNVAAVLNPITGGWDRDKVELLLPSHSEEIFLLKPSKTRSRDAHSWLGTRNGDYSTKTGYYTAMAKRTLAEGTPQQANFYWMADIWLIPIPPKLRVFLWKIVQKALPLGDNLESRGIIATNLNCIHCGAREQRTIYSLRARLRFKSGTSLRSNMCQA